MLLRNKVSSTPNSVFTQRTFTLSKRIAAVRPIQEGDGQGKLGEIVQLPPGCRLDRYGNGYNERTVKVHCRGEFYFVFLEDLQATE
jgi:hypothetical protein